MTGAGERIPLQPAAGVPLDAIERELAELWRRAGETASKTESGEAALVRACGLTVIGVAASAESLSRMAPQIGAATVVVPARTILVSLEDSVPGGLEAEIAAFCTFGGPAGRQVCQEQVVLRAARERARDVAPVVTPLAVPDLPVVLVVKEPKLLFGSLVGALAPAADLLLADTRDAPDVVEAFLRLRAIADGEPVSVRDFAFERLLPWREALADAFDDVLARGGRFATVTVVCPENDAEGVLLAGFIESRFPDEDRPRVDIVHSDGEATCVTAVEVECEAGDGQRWTERFGQFGRHVIRVENEFASTRDLPRPAPTEIEILTGLLSDPEPSRVYEAALAAACRRFGRDT